MLVDSHCHLTDKRYEEDRIAVLQRAWSAGVEQVLSVASNRADALSVLNLLDLAPEQDGIPELWGSAGVHPHEAEEAQEGDLDALREIIRDHDRIRAVGETGLDFFYDNSPRDTQESLFQDHLELGETLGYPVIVHSRSADEATIRILQEWGDRVVGVLHCYTGGPDLLEMALGKGWMISFTGIITFKKYDGQALVRSIPRDRLMVETDGPYLAPVPFRGKRNEPAYVREVAEALARIRGETADEVVEYTGENAVRFFGLGS